MWTKQNGMTLVELIIAMIIISVGVGGILVAYNTTTKNSVDPLVQKQMVAIAEGMMEEIQRMPFAPALPTAPGGCLRSTHNDLLDYAAYDCADATDMLGNVRLSGYRVRVAVVADPSAAFTGVTAGDVMKITVTVSHLGSSMNLVGWRTNYARLIS